MIRSSRLFILALALCAAPGAASAQMMPAGAPATAAPAPSAEEAAFLKRIMTNLPRLYPNPQAAVAAGYVRYTNEDETGAISYVNTKYWDTTDANFPSQLWYDVRGRLLGADFSTPQASSTAAPSRFGLEASRWSKENAHVHYVLRKAGGKFTYGKAVGAKKYAAANDDSFASPTAAGLVKTGAVADAASVSYVFLFPAIWDTTIWVVPNPLGQFAEKNPAVKPSAHAGKGEDDPM